MPKSQAITITCDLLFYMVVFGFFLNSCKPNTTKTRVRPMGSPSYLGGGAGN